ncbi:hypothetical protein EDI_326650 [Entamoeba dispar SAW760]|uniref:Uncharacterized protein n=1 Tax=Entamoeba dispar (strain ATCC PRA-260 / SAW760) TaxID=370354 RepID=B0ENI9_ENTDS|nr:uncharacterized protein EDI_326650 [Entamoeba dispar SAW760]EDR23909.1 hypothetical protein EDI_326650 [Entamoeba dispar SAW760]|eukprot:EDR23909.1 hypothetical protein EDI_326650 [Entamoeba dispar SAW760]
MSTVNDSLCTSETTETCIIFGVSNTVKEIEETSNEQYSKNGWGNDSSSTIVQPINPEFLVFPVDEESEKGIYSNELNIQILKEIEATMNKLQKANKKKDKLARLTGRRNSLEKISPFLVSETSEEAIRNGSLVLKSDHIKQKIGERPDPIILSKHIIDNKKSFDKNEWKTKEKINKISKIFGRPDSITTIALLLQSSSPNEAIINSIKIKKMEKLKKLAGIE